MKTFIIGVTGVIGSGKTTLCHLLEKRGFISLDGDAITHELYKKGNRGYDCILNYFGPYYVTNKAVSRPRLRALVLKNHQKLWILNTVIHPIIRQEVNKKIDQLKLIYKKTSTSSGPLKCLVEAVFFEPRDIGTFVDTIIRIDADNDVIIERLKNNRNLPISHVRKWLLNQRKVLRDIPVTIMNNTTIQDLESSLKQCSEEFP